MQSHIPRFNIHSYLISGKTSKCSKWHWLFLFQLSVQKLFLITINDIQKRVLETPSSLTACFDQLWLNNDNQVVTVAFILSQNLTKQSERILLIYVQQGINLSYKLINSQVYSLIFYMDLSELHIYDTS